MFNLRGRNNINKHACTHTQTHSSCSNSSEGKACTTLRVQNLVCISRERWIAPLPPCRRCPYLSPTLIANSASARLTPLFELCKISFKVCLANRYLDSFYYKGILFLTPSHAIYIYIKKYKDHLQHLYTT